MLSKYNKISSILSYMLIAGMYKLYSFPVFKKLKVVANISSIGHILGMHTF